MRILRLHAPHTDPVLAAGLSDAVRRFNGGLDIRLRFLSIGIEESVVEVASAAEAVDALAGVAPQDGAQNPTASRAAPGSAQPRPALVLLLGDGETAAAAATACARIGLRLVRIGAGRRDGPHADTARAIDRLAAVRFVFDDAALQCLADEDSLRFDLVVGPADELETATRIVNSLARARRAEHGGS